MRVSFSVNRPPAAFRHKPCCHQKVDGTQERRYVAECDEVRGQRKCRLSPSFFIYLLLSSCFLLSSCYYQEEDATLYEVGDNFVLSADSLHLQSSQPLHNLPIDTACEQLSVYRNNQLVVAETLSSRVWCQTTPFRSSSTSSASAILGFSASSSPFLWRHCFTKYIVERSLTSSSFATSYLPTPLTYSSRLPPLPCSMQAFSITCPKRGCSTTIIPRSIPSAFRLS